MTLRLTVSPEWRLQFFNDAVEFTQNGIRITVSMLQAWDARGMAVPAQDANGNLITGSTAAVTITSSPAGATATAIAVSGVLTFPNLVFSAPGSYTLTATSSGFSPATSRAFTIAGNNGSRLFFITQPFNAIAGTAISPVAVQVQDSLGNLATSSNASITLTSRPAGLSVSAAAVNGVAAFSGLVLTAPGTHSLTATAPGLTSATSS